MYKNGYKDSSWLCLIASLLQKNPKFACEGASESAELVTKAHLSLTGASGKVGLYFDKDNNKWYLPIGEAPSTHIVKQSHVRYKRIVANEQLCLLTAGNLGIDTSKSFIVTTYGNDEEAILLATERYDRILNEEKCIGNLNAPYRLHQEDFAQALGIAASDKYEKKADEHIKLIFDLIRRYSADPLTDSMKLWDICVFNYLVGNTDNHIKNISLLYSENLKSVRLAPAYDLVSTVVYKSSAENMAFSIDGIYSINDICRKSFENAAVKAGIGSTMAMRRFDKMVSDFENALMLAKEELISNGFDQAYQISNLIMKNGGIAKELRRLRQK